MLTVTQLLLLIIGCVQLKVVAGKHLIRAGLPYSIPCGNSRSGKNDLFSVKVENQHFQPNITSGGNQFSSLSEKGYSGKARSKIEISRKKRHLPSQFSSTDIKERNDHELVNRCKKTHRWKMKTDKRKESKKFTQCHCPHQSKPGRHRLSKAKSSTLGLQPKKTKGANFEFQRGMSASNNYKTGDLRRNLLYNGGNTHGKSLPLPFVVVSYPPPSMHANGWFTNVRPYYGQLSDAAYFRNGLNPARMGPFENIPKAPFLNLIPATGTPASHGGPKQLPGLSVNFNKPLGRGSGRYKNWEQPSPLRKIDPEYRECCPMGGQNEDVPYDSDGQNISGYNTKVGSEYEIISSDEDHNDYDQDSLEASTGDLGFRGLEGLSTQSTALESFLDDGDDEDDEYQQVSPASSFDDHETYHDQDSAIAVGDESVPSDLDGSNDDHYMNLNYGDDSPPQSDPNQECCDTDVEESKDADPNHNFPHWRTASEAEYTIFPERALETQENEDGSDGNSKISSELASQTQKSLDVGDRTNFLDGITADVLPASNSAEIFPGMFAASNSDQTINTTYTNPPEQNFKRRRRKNLGHLIGAFMKKTNDARLQNETTPETVLELTTPPLVILETTQNMLFSEMKEEMLAMQATRASKSQFKNKARFRFLKEKTSET